MIINKKWAMPNHKTFSIKPINELIQKYFKDSMVSIDPFSNDCGIALITNDLNPEMPTDYHLDAIDFLKTFKDNSVDFVFYDPPYSLRQVSECYKGVGKKVTMEDTQSSWRRKHLDEIQRILKNDGLVMCFGWNSSGVGKKKRV